jgi:hypothetical protein
MHRNKGIMFANGDARKHIEKCRNSLERFMIAKGSSKPQGFSSGLPPHRTN